MLILYLIRYLIRIYENRFIIFGTDKPIILTGLLFFIILNLKFKLRPIFNRFYLFLYFLVKPVRTNFVPQTDI
jgi:hypothetical protein